MSMFSQLATLRNSAVAKGRSLRCRGCLRERMYWKCTVCIIGLTHSMIVLCRRMAISRCLVKHKHSTSSSKDRFATEAAQAWRICEWRLANCPHVGSRSCETSQRPYVIAGEAWETARRCVVEVSADHYTALSRCSRMDGLTDTSL